MSADELAWVFAYGSNMNLADLRAWFVRKLNFEPHITRVERATLPGYRLVWNYFSKSREAGAANVERADANLPGVALQVNASTLRGIDKKEGHPDVYSRGDHPVPMYLADGNGIEAWLYVALPSVCKATPQWPSRDYLDLLIRAAEEHGLPDEHIARLKATPTVEVSRG